MVNRFGVERVVWWVEVFVDIMIFVFGFEKYIVGCFSGVNEIGLVDEFNCKSCLVVNWGYFCGFNDLFIIVFLVYVLFNVSYVYYVWKGMEVELLSS